MKKAFKKNTEKRHLNLNAPQHLFCRCLCTNCKKNFAKYSTLLGLTSVSRFFCARESRVVALEVVTLMDTRTPTVRENLK